MHRADGDGAPGASYAIGVDIGGTKIAAGLVNLGDGALVSRRVVATDASDGGRPALAAAVALATELHEAARREGRAIAGIGVGVPELVDREGDASLWRITACEP